MNNKKKKNGSALVPIIFLLSAVLAALIVVVILLESHNLPAIGGTTTVPTHSQTQTQPPSSSSVQPDGTVPSAQTYPTEDNTMIELETPYCSLYFPEMWEDLLHINTVEQDGYRMEFGCQMEDGKVYRMFDIIFGTGGGIPLGAVNGPDGQRVHVYIQFYEPDEALEGDLLETFLAMQEDVNRLISQLPLSSGNQEPATEPTQPTTGGDQTPTTAPTQPTTGGDQPTTAPTQPTTAPTQPTTGNDVQIRTPYCTLRYPGQWERYLLVEQKDGSDYTVGFYANFDGGKKVLLFSLKFNAHVDDAIMVLKDQAGASVGLHIEMDEVDESGLTDAQIDTVYSMQDALNELLDALSDSIVD